MTKPTQKTATQTSTPWAEQVPYLKEAMTGASDLYKSGSSTVAPMSAQTGTALSAIGNIARAGDPNMRGSQAALGQLLGGTGVGGDALTATARGDNLSAVNPFLQKQLDDQSSQISDQVKAQFGGAGRYGSVNFGQALADRIGSFRGDVLSTNWENERNRQLQAAGTLQGNQMGALGLAPTINQMRYGDATQLLNAGGVTDAYKQQQVDDPWQRLQRYSGLISGSGSGGTTTKTEPGPSMLSQILGGLVGAGGVVGKIGSLSDIRAKTDIRRIGKTDGGTPIYTYRLKSGGPVQMGVMAQHLALTQPEAVSVRPDGLLQVQYDLVV